MKDITQKEFDEIVRKHARWNYDYSLPTPSDGEQAELIEVDLRKINFKNVNLMEADMQGCDLCEVDLTSTNLYRVNLSNAILHKANMSHISLNYADLIGADLQEAILHATRLCNANLLGANLRSADLKDADLNDAYLHEADLRGANLNGADLDGADLSYADLRGADLDVAHLGNVNLECTKLDDYFVSLRISQNSREKLVYNVTKNIIWYDWFKGSLEEFDARRNEITQADSERDKQDCLTTVAYLETMYKLHQSFGAKPVVRIIKRVKIGKHQ